MSHISTYLIDVSRVFTSACYEINQAEGAKRVPKTLIL
jgi:hypothetical protein